MAVDIQALSAVDTVVGKWWPFLPHLVRQGSYHDALAVTGMAAISSSLVLVGGEGFKHPGVGRDATRAPSW